MDNYNETPVQFGPDGSVIGVITTPGNGPMAPVACLMLNMGAIHRIGPRRSNVKLAREMAARGVSSIRFDLSGLGDSPPASAGVNFRAQAVLDMQAAMSLIGTMLGVHRFIVIGLCSGAQNGMSLAVADARVVGLLMFDGLGFLGRRARWERSTRRALADASFGAVVARVSRTLKRVLWPKPTVSEAPDIFEDESAEDTPANFCRSMNLLAERDVAMMLFYTGTVNVKDRHLDQLGPFVNEPFVRKLDYRFHREVDHGLISQASQHTFLTVVGDWILRVIKGEGTPPTPARTPPAAAAAPRPRNTQLSSITAMRQRASS